MDIANDNEAVVASPEAAGNSVLPRAFRDMLDQCDRVGISLDVVMNIIRVRLYEAGFNQTESTERALTALRNVIERHR